MGFPPPGKRHMHQNRPLIFFKKKISMGQVSLRCQYHDVILASWYLKSLLIWLFFSLAIDCLFNSLLNLTTRERSKLHITCLLWREFTCDQYIPLTKGQQCLVATFLWTGALLYLGDPTALLVTHMAHLETRKNWKWLLSSLAPGRWGCNLILGTSKLTSWTDILCISCKITLRWMPQDLIDD